MEKYRANANASGSLAAPRGEPGFAYARRVTIAAGIVTLFVSAAAAFARAYDVFFLLFAAVLLAVLLRGLSERLGKRLGLGPAWSLAGVLAVGVALAAGAIYATGSMVTGQIEQLSAELPRSIEQAKSYLRQYQWGRAALDHMPSLGSFLSGSAGNAASTVTSFFSTTFGVMGNLFVLTFLAIYLAATPQLYVTGLVLLAPPRHRDRAKQVLNAVGFQLWKWLIGRAIAMVAVAVIVVAGLWLVGVPQFLVLGLLAGLLTAIPFIGPILAAIPGVLLALMQGPTMALWALGVYLLSQAIENYLITPLVQQKAVSLPPAVAIAAITLIGVLFGVMGLIVATPLAVVLMVAIKMLYIEDTLGDDAGVRGAIRE